ADRLKAPLEVVAALNAELAPFRILTGIEVDILEDGSLDQDEELLAGLDVVVASVHSKLKMEGPAMTRRILVARGRKPSNFDPEAVFGACAATGTAVEINSRPERRDPPADLLRSA